MSASVHACRVYQIDYDTVGINGWSRIEDFIRFLCKQQFDGVEGIWISENEEDIEIDFSTLEYLKNDEEWGKVIQNIIDTSDKRNAYARLAIF